MIKIKFLDAQEVKDGEGIVIEKWRAGQVVELNNGSARFWLSRGLALDVQGGKLPADGPRGPQSKSEEGRFVDKTAKKSTETEPVEEKPEVATGKVDPTSPKRGRGRRRSASRPAQA